MTGFARRVGLVVSMLVAGALLACDPQTTSDEQGGSAGDSSTGGETAAAGAAGAPDSAGAPGAGGTGGTGQTCVGAVMTIICDGIPNEHPDCNGREGTIRRWCEGTTYMSEFVPAPGAAGAAGG